PEYVQQVHDCGHKVHVWTVDEMADVDLCLQLGVDAIITNHPGDVIARLKKWNPLSAPVV
ncbi:MAG: glycerophosphodiester phosphodiesterase family protein, partial [Candidatus Nanopelagicales bacterium]|nr:glycerophosphodiester phosphodiesterase family protein [Candidatus Nanopelagicales bacterium]